MRKIQVWGHRGASGYAPENTLPSFALAAKMGADGVELDIQKTKDGQIVVIHDETVDRTAFSSGFVKDFTYEEIRAMKIRNAGKYEEARIPLMSEVFDLLKDTDLLINIELKTGVFDYAGIEEEIVSMVKEKGYEDRVIYSSFNHYSIMKLKKIDPKAKTAFLYQDGFMDIAEYGKKYGVDALHPWVENLRYPGFMEEAEKNGLDVNVWTVNSEKELKLCKKCNVHAVITNYPDRALEFLEEE